MQASVDAINAQYVNLFAQEKVAGEDRSGQARAMNARSGLIGSDFGTANQEKTTQFNSQQVQALEAQKQGQVQSVLINIEDRATAEIDRRKQEALGKYQMEMGEFEKDQEQARADFTSLAKAGVDLNTLNPAQKAALFKQAGYDESFGELIYNANKPKPAQIDYKFEKLSNGKGMFYGVDPNTGELKRMEIDIDLPPEWQVQIAPDGTVIGFDKNTGQARLLSEQGQFAKPEEAEQLYAGLNKEQVSQLQRVQTNVRQDADVKDFIQIRDGYERVSTGAQRDDAQGDLALLFGYMKLLDPTSVVRETEFANAEQAQGTLQRWMNIPSKFLKGTRLTPEARRHFEDAAKDLYSRKEQSYQRAVDFYGNQLDQFGIPRELGLRDFGSTIGDVDSDLDNLWGETVGDVPPVDLQRARNSGGLSFNSVAGDTNNLQSLTGQSKLLASTMIQKYPPNSDGGQCGDFVRKVANSFGLDYPRLGNTLASKTAAVRAHGTSLANAQTGSVLVTSEASDTGHVTWIIGKNASGYIVAESNKNPKTNPEKISYGRVIPFNSPKIVGVINPKRTA